MKRILFSLFILLSIAGLLWAIPPMPPSPTGAGGLASTDIDTSAEVLTIVTDEVGSGALVGATAPTFVTSVGLPNTITSAGTVTWTMVDNQNAAIAFRSEGSNDILKLTTTDGGPGATVTGFFTSTGLITGDDVTASDALTGLSVTATGGNLKLGGNDSIYGLLDLYGAATGSDNGGYAKFYTAADHDTTINEYGIRVLQDDFIIGPDTDTDFFKIAAGSVATMTGGFSYDSATGALTVTTLIGDVTGNVSGSAGTVTDTELAAIQGLTFVDASIIQLTGAGTAAVLTSGGNNYILGSNVGNTGLEFKTPAEVLSQIGAQGVDADLTTIAGLTPVQSKVIISNAAPAWSVSAWTIADPGASGAIIQSDGTNWTRSTSLNVTAINLPSTDADPGTTAGQIRHDSSSTEASTAARGVLKYWDGTEVRTILDTGAVATLITKYQYLPIRYAEDDDTVAAPAAAAEIGTTGLIARSFVEDADNGVLFYWQVPGDFVSGIKYRVYYATDTNAGADETAVFGLSGCSAGDLDAITCAEGSQVDVTDELADTYDTGELIVSPWSAAVTVTDILAGEFAHLLLIRDISADDMVGHALVTGIEIKYVGKINPFSDY